MIDKNMIALEEIRNGYTLNKYENLTFEQNSLIKYDNLCLKLIEENQELKNSINALQKELNEENFQCSKYAIENKELKKQLEEYKRLGFKHLNDKCNKLENQQKEFIEYMTKTIEECNNYSKYIEKKTKELHGRSCGKTYIANEIMKNEVAKKVLKEIFSKYEEIIGVSDENNKQ